MTDHPNDLFIDLTVGIVSAYVGHNTLPASGLADLIAEVHAALGKAVSGPALQPKTEIVAPAVQPKKSVTPDFIVCLEDGKRFKSLKRHLRTAHGLSPEAYREKWGLSVDYPMVAPTTPRPDRLWRRRSVSASSGDAARVERSGGPWENDPLTAKKEEFPR